MSPSPHHVHFAAIDVGSHTIRLLIARAEGKEILPVRIERRITRLANNFQRREMLEEDSIRESIRVLDEYSRLLSDFHVRSTACGATGVVRRAGNTGDFLQAVQNTTGLRLSVLSEESEALLSAKGVLSALPNPQDIVLIFDLGGSSTEFLLLDTLSSKALWHTSIFIGAATVTERYLRGDPPDPTSITNAIDAVQSLIDPVVGKIDAVLAAIDASHPKIQLVGTAGTATTLAAMNLKMTQYEPYRVNGSILSEKWLTTTVDSLASLSVASRQGIPGLEKGREDIILGGALIVREILRGLRQDRVLITDAGLLEGLLLALVEREHGLQAGLLTPLTWRWQKG